MASSRKVVSTENSADLDNSINTNGRKGNTVAADDGVQTTTQSTNRRQVQIPQSVQEYIDRGKAAAAAAQAQLNETKQAASSSDKQSSATTPSGSTGKGYSAPTGQATGALGQSGDSSLPVISQANSMVTTEKMETKDIIAEAGKGMLTVIGVAAVATAVVLVLTGVAQNYARKKRYKVGNSAFWTWLAKIPSLAHPRPFFYKIGDYNGVYQGDKNCGQVYNELSLLPCIKTELDDIVPLDDWGGWLALYIVHGEEKDLITGYEESSRSIQVVDKDFRIKWYKIPELSEVAGVLWLTENQ